MYCKVLIIDDEYIMRQGIRHMIDWEKEGYQIVGEATNGEEGLAMMEEYQPDIVLADIVMPVLDGMEFSMIVKKRFPQTKLIILSGYDKFEYVRKTLLNGACDYVRKPSLNPETLLHVLERAAAQIPGMCLQKHSVLSVNEKLNRILNGYETDFTERDFEHRFPYSKCRLLLSKDSIESGSRLEDGMELLRCLQDYWNEQEEYEVEVLLESGEIAIVLINYRMRDESRILRQAAQCVQMVNRHHPGGFWIYGSAFAGLSDLMGSFQQTCELADLRFYYKDTPLLCADSTVERIQAERFAHEQYAEQLKYHHFQEALDQIGTYASYMCSCMVEEYLLKNTVKNLLYNFLLEKERADSKTAVSRAEFFRQIDKSRYEEDFKQVLTLILEELGHECAPKISEDESLVRIRQYINEHYAENLELTRIAKQFNYNYNYLSTYFNRKMKESFSEYLNRIRIEKACEILRTTSYTIARVSEMVGYSDPSYFSRIFKNQMGSTPSQWKRENVGGSQ